MANIDEYANDIEAAAVPTVLVSCFFRRINTFIGEVDDLVKNIKYTQKALKEDADQVAKAYQQRQIDLIQGCKDLLAKNTQGVYDYLDVVAAQPASQKRIH